MNDCDTERSLTVTIDIFYAKLVLKAKSCV